MKKIAILTETSADLTERQRSYPCLYQIPLYIVFNEESYKENEEITHEEYYRLIKESDTLPTTSQPTPRDFVEKYQEILDDGYHEIIVVTMSDKLSGTNQSAQIAAEGFSQVQVFSTRMATVGVGLMAEQACLLVDKGFNSREIMSRLAELDRQTSLVAMLVTIENIVKGGRLPKIAGQIQSMLGLNIIVRLNDGKVSLVRQTRTKSRGYQAMVDEFAKALEASDRPLKVMVGHVDSPESGQALLERLEESFPQVDFELNSIGPVIGTHGGTGAVGLAWLPDLEDE